MKPSKENGTFIVKQNESLNFILESNVFLWMFQPNTNYLISIWFIIYRIFQGYGKFLWFFFIFRLAWVAVILDKRFIVHLEYIFIPRIKFCYFAICLRKEKQSVTLLMDIVLKALIIIIIYPWKGLTYLFYYKKLVHYPPQHNIIGADKCIHWNNVMMINFDQQVSLAGVFSLTHKTWFKDIQM